MTRILIIGKKSFLGSNLKVYLSKYFNIDNYSYEAAIKKDPIFFKKYTHIINTAIHFKYIRCKYKNKFDLDKKFIKKFDNIAFYYIFFNTRKIYFPKENITERCLIKPRDVYAQNKFLTEKFLKLRLKKKLISLRISNILGSRFYKITRNNHKLFFDNFLNYKKMKIKKKIIIEDDFKDFLSIDQFCRIIFKIIKLNVSGTYNVSISKKIYLSEIIEWLDQSVLEKFNFNKSTKNSFTLANAKLLKKIDIKITKNQLKKFCKKLF